MGNRLSFLIVLTLDLVACASGGAPASAPSSSTGASVEGPSPLPGVALVTLAGDPVAVAGVARGRVALVSLWATWCEACQKEMDALNRLDAKTGSDAVVIGVAVGEKRELVAEFAHRRGLRYMQLVDPEFAFADALGQRRLPATLVVDRRGRIVFRGEDLDVASLEALRRAVAQVE
jgi:thiol-disulfide isomerase/thioredoxin